MDPTTAVSIMNFVVAGGPWAAVVAMAGGVVFVAQWAARKTLASLEARIAELIVEVQKKETAWEESRAALLAQERECAERVRVLTERVGRLEGAREKNAPVR